MAKKIFLTKKLKKNGQSKKKNWEKNLDKISIFG